VNHVALVIPGLHRIGGAERQVIFLAKGLLQRGWRVSVITLSGDGGDAAAELTAQGAAFMTLQMRKGLADPCGWIRFNRWLYRESPDIVHAHLPHAAWFARWSRLAAPPCAVVDTLHSCTTGTVGRRIGYRCSNWLTDQVTAVSHAAAEAHRSAAMVSDSKLTVLPNGVDGDHWQPNMAARTETRQQLGINREFLWFAAGRLEPVKDYPTLLAAMAKIMDPVRLLIAGAGPLQSELASLSVQLGLERRVRFLGFESDIRRWMQAADGFVLSSLREGLPLALLEAAACALPAVATCIPGTTEVIDDGQTGWLAPAGNAAALAESMTRMMRLSADERLAMGMKARDRAIERFSLDVVLDRWEEMYMRLLQSKSSLIGCEAAD
jgi:glycosyltransferase involved in cell wall biosynthesis